MSEGHGYPLVITNNKGGGVEPKKKNNWAKVEIFFFSPICGVAKRGDHPQEVLAKFGYIQDVKVG